MFKCESANRALCQKGASDGLEFNFKISITIDLESEDENLLEVYKLVD